MRFKNELQFYLHRKSTIMSDKEVGRLGVSWISVAEINWLTLSEDPRKQTDKFGVVVDNPRIHGLVGSPGRKST